jgi:2-hydroxycyclohexanecarboxyl-CoA dehydrogenase
MERVALVTGGARGIGRAIATALARDGLAVAVGDLRFEEQPTDALAVDLDVTSTDSVAAAVARVTDELGPIEVLVNNAGWDELKPFVDTDEAFWQRVIDINYTGCLRVTHAVLPGMIERGCGRIVSIGSDAGRVGSSHEAVYAGCKGAIIAFMKTVAREVARYSITANTVCPGPTDTPLLAGITAAAPDADKVISAMTRGVPMRRLGQPEDVAEAVAFFASDRAGYITGQTLSVSGGLTMA